MTPFGERRSYQELVCCFVVCKFVGSMSGSKMSYTAPSKLHSGVQPILKDVDFGRGFCAPQAENGSRARLATIGGQKFSGSLDCFSIALDDDHGLVIYAVLFAILA